MSLHSLFRLDTGELTGMQVHGSPEILALNTPPGCAWVAGAHDPRRAVVQLVVDDFGASQPVATPRLPPRPADSDYRTWAWDAALDDWAPAYTLLWHQVQARDPVLAQLAALDTQVARPVGEIAEAQALGQAVPAASLQRLTAINSDKAALRAHLAAIAAAPDIPALQAVLAAAPTLTTP